MGYFIPAYSGNSRKRLLSTPKFVFFDSGVRNACAKTGFYPEMLQETGGQLLEDWVATELYHRVKLLGAPYELSYYRTVGGAEIDFLVNTPTGILPIEVKYSETPSREDACHIEAFIDSEKNIRNGYLVCRCKEPRQISEHVTAIPWDQF